MRALLSLLAAAAVAAGAVALSAPSANAIKCPDGTYPAPVVTVAGHTVNGCAFAPGCDPGPCTPPATAAAPRD